tara:strand:- start:955 stop:1512 length:558 start_codon:yes stop_codon:yes gene_type:complete
VRLYTGRGDDGNTDLFGGDRVPKHHLRVDAYGAADEMNASLGLAVTACGPTDERLHEILLRLQDRTFVLGADLATIPGGPHEDKVARIQMSDVKELEGFIDEIDGDNEALKTFILPGGCELASRLHLARAISRRCERQVTRMLESEGGDMAKLLWMNRISDLLFAMARAANRLQGLPDVPWTPSD